MPEESLGLGPGWTEQWTQHRGSVGARYLLFYVPEQEQTVKDPNLDVFWAVVDNRPHVTALPASIERVGLGGQSAGIQLEVVMDQTRNLSSALPEYVVAPAWTGPIPLDFLAEVFGESVDVTFKLHAVKYNGAVPSEEELQEVQERAQQEQEDLGEGSFRDTAGEVASAGQELGKLLGVAALAVLVIMVVLASVDQSFGS